jgi:hypothetical protein
MRSKLQCLSVEVCPAVVCAAAVLMVAAILLLPLGAHRFEGKASHSRASTILAQGTGGAEARKIEPVVRTRAVESYGKLPLSFEVNKGQTDSRVKFLSRGSGYSLFLTGNEAVLALRKGSRQSKVESRTSVVAPGIRPDNIWRTAHQGSADLFSKSAAFPGFFRPPATEWRDESMPFTATNNEPRTTDALLRLKLVGANPNPKIVGMDELPGKSNYFIGNDPKKWRTNVPNYAKVKYANVYPGVDLVYYGNQGQLEYDFVVRPGADPNSIQLAINSGEQVGSRQKAVGRTAQPQDPEPEGQSAIVNPKSPIAAPLHVNATGDLAVGTDGGEVIFHKPAVYQPATYNERRTTNGGGRNLVEGQYVLRGDNRIAFQLADYDRRRPVIIDPVLAYSTYLGEASGFEQTVGIAVDASGNAYVTGGTGSTDFPTSPGAFQKTCGGGAPSYSCADAFVSKLNAGGTALLYSTYLGGSGDNAEFGVFNNRIAVDASGNAYVTGATDSPNFPTTAGAFQTRLAGSYDAFISKLNGTGSALLYSTYLGGNGEELGYGIAIDASGNAYVSGFTDSTNLPTTPGAFQTTLGGGWDAFVGKLNARGSALLYCTYLGGGGDEQGVGIAVDSSGDAYVTGNTQSSNFPTTPGALQSAWAPDAQGFVSKLNPTGSSLVYSTYLVGYANGNGIAVDSVGNAYIAGDAGTGFPTTPGAFQVSYGGGPQDAFVSKLNPAGSILVYSTYLGGSDWDFGFGIAIDASGNAYVTGLTYSSNFPTTPNALQAAFGGGPNGNAFVSKLNATGSAPLYSTYLGGSAGGQGLSIAVDASGSAYVTGFSSSTFPITPGAFQTALEGGVVSKISAADVPGLALGPGTLIFAPQAVGTTSAPQTAVLYDAGSQPLSITSIVAGGEFAQTADCGSTVPTGTHCTISVTFTPKGTGTRSGAVTITDNAAGSPHELVLTGTGGGEPAVTFKPPSLTFAAQLVFTTSPPQQVTLTNTGTAALDIASIATTGDFAQTNDCGSAVQATKDCTFSVTFTPTAPGTRSGAITITDDAPGSPHNLLLTGTGSAGPPVVSLTPASVSFQLLRAVGTTSVPQMVKLTNVGSGPFDITGISVTGPDARDFFQSNNCPPPMAARASCLIAVTFKPTAQGVRTASVSITDNAPGSPQSVPLTGRSTFLEWSPRYMNLGDEPVGTSSPPRTVKLTNVGPAPIAIFSIVIGGVNLGDFSETNTCGTSLKAGASCTIEVTFTPTAVGSRLGHVAIQDNAFGGTHWVGLLGKGT